MTSSEPAADLTSFLTDQHRTLLRIRDTLYEGNWADFMRDLRARAVDKPHVFNIVPPTPEAREVIQSHLTMIEAMQRWEASHGRTLGADGQEACPHDPDDKPNPKDARGI